MRRLRALAANDAVATSVVAVGITLLATWFALDLWVMRWDVPLVYMGDALPIGAHIKTVLETGWYESQSALGAPFGQVYHDYPIADNLHFAVAALLGLVLPSWGAVMNVHFVLGFPLAALTAVWFLRRVGVRPVMTVVLAVLFALAPYHFLRNEGHLFLAWYWVVPLALGLVWAALRGDPLWGAREGARRGFGHLTGTTGTTMLIIVLLASSSVYYAAFTLILGGIASVAAFWVRRDSRRLLGAVAAAGSIIAVLLINMAPDFIYSAQIGPNPGALQRTPVESELYALKLAQLLLPPAYHRFGPFNYLREQYDFFYPLPSESPALGLLAAGGLVALFITAFYVLARNGLSRNLENSPLLSRLSSLSFLALLGFIFATVGGLSTLISFVSTNLRAWNRMSIVIAALALAALGLLIDALVSRSTAALSPRAAIAASISVGALILGFGLWDQTPPVDRSARAATIASFDSDAAFVAEIEQALPRGSMVFQLPYIAFPESPPVNRTLDGDQLRPYLHSSELRFSGGGIRGRPDIDSLGEVASLAPQDFVIQASALGYSGVIVDTYAYEDDRLVDELRELTSTPPIVSPDARFVFFAF